MKWLLLPLVLLLILILILLLIPIKVRLRYDCSPQVWVGIGAPFYKVYPFKPKKEKTKKTVKKKKSKKNTKQKKQAQKLTPQLILGYLKLAKKAFGIFIKALRINNFTLHAVISGNDASKTAIKYGIAASTISAILPLLERDFKCKGTDIEINANFENDQESILFDITITALTIIMAIGGIKLLFIFKDIRDNDKKRKGVINE